MATNNIQQRTRKYISARRHHPAWLLLASPRAPLVLGCLTTLFEFADDGVAEADALQALSEMLADYAAQDEYDIAPDNLQTVGEDRAPSFIKQQSVQSTLNSVSRTQPQIVSTANFLKLSIGR
ncbi:DUF3375 family protein [Alcanivorax quisquiliarum]|uniref:DUF3375 domain-containing protein n=1 Tax=Alcanivorax quisquiliarum TaxID=2933565 RepID=A0ABT0E6W2_9GAMM|nr:DUF3375 family protein [Alcanivorax quisquiliarum]MCK0537551.1 DUF3375 domain-containing protein [Alcanivorax quisquiliarum]